MDKRLYKPRMIDRQLEEYLSAFGAVCVEGPPLWDAVRYQVDQSPQKGQFILTSSDIPNHKGILHSGAGRIAVENPGTSAAKSPWSNCAKVS